MSYAADDIPFEEMYTAEDLADAASILYGATHITNGAGPDTSESWEPLKASAFLELPEPEGTELLGPLVLRSGRTIIGGDSGHGKTTLAYAMISAIVSGGELLGCQGAGLGPGLIIDLEQGVRSIKRGIRDAELGDEVFILNLPDGLALDQNPGELLRLEEAIVTLEPSVISLDPYYKAHRGDANEERAVTDLMRNLDRLRTDYMFALILPAHVRKDIQGGGVRKLTLADIAGSGAISRGAEVVLGLERLSHGQARLRYLKDREGDLPVGDALDLSYSSEDGFTVNEVQSSESIEDQILAVENSGWMTTREWCKEIGLGHNETKRVLERMAAMNPPRIDYEIGPHGRSSNAKCYSTSGVLRVPVQSSTPSTHEGSGVGVPTVLTPLRSRGSVSTQADPPGGVLSTPDSEDDIPL